MLNQPNSQYRILSSYRSSAWGFLYQLEQVNSGHCGVICGLKTLRLFWKMVSAGPFNHSSLQPILH